MQSTFKIYVHLLFKAGRFSSHKPNLQRMRQQLQHVCPLRKHQQPSGCICACDGQHPAHHRLQLHEHRRTVSIDEVNDGRMQM